MPRTADTKFIIKKTSWGSLSNNDASYDVAEVERRIKNTIHLRVGSTIDDKLTVTVPNIDKLLQLSDEFGELIITEEDGYPCIEIYDDLREGK